MSKLVCFLLDEQRAFFEGGKITDMYETIHIHPVSILRLCGFLLPVAHISLQRNA
jgi:hypothetical protein